MRILYVTNYYPPHYVGGYELQCAATAQWLAARGHTVRVLAGDYLLQNVPEEEKDTHQVEVFRDLTLRYWTDITSLGYWKRETRDVGIFRRHLREFQPDLVAVWNPFKLATGILMEAQEKAPCLVYHVHDEWMANFHTSNGLPQFWARPATSTPGRLLKPLLRRLYRKYFTPDISVWKPENIIFVSPSVAALTASAEIRAPHTLVAYVTYRSERFEQLPPRQKAPGGELRFLWAGRLCREKGLLTTLNALDILWEKAPAGWTVDFIGSMDEKDEQSILRPRLQTAPWKNQVRYRGFISWHFVPEEFNRHDVFLFTSEIHEGMPTTIIEAFASGMPVIGTLTGGTRDILRPGENCLVYEMGDARQLADAMLRLLRDEAERRRISETTARFARDQFHPDAVFPRLLEFYQKLASEKQAVNSTKYR